MTGRAVLAASATALLVAAACADDDASEASTAKSIAAPDTSLVASATAPTTPTAPTASDAGSVPASTPTPATAAPSTTTPPQPTGEAPAVTLTEIGRFAAPVDLAWRAGDDALYIAEQGGTVQQVTDEGTRAVLDITDLTNASGEQGLLGLTFSPAGDFAYADYTDLNGDTTIAEFPVDADGTFRTGDEARTVLFIDQPYANHNGGEVVFGPDGLLYIGMGDGGSSGDPDRRASNLGDLLGKLLRIDPTVSGGQPYTVPADNPYVGQQGAAPEIWASGLRNPWRFSFDRVTGDLWIADVGQNSVEEIDVVTATGGRDAGRGVNFGWSAFEGDRPYNSDVEVADPVAPFHTYTHADGCSVNGGVRARGPQVPDLVGWYVYGDWCTGEIWALEVLGEGTAMAPGRQVTLGPLPAITAAVDGPHGEVYVLSQEGSVVRLDPAG